MALEGVLTKEFVFAEFKKLKTNAEKVNYLKELILHCHWPYGVIV